LLSNNNDAQYKHGGGKVICIVKYADDLVLLAMGKNGTTGHN